MSPKSKHGKGKRFHHRKKGQFRQSQAGAGLTQETSGDISTPTTALNAAPVVKTPVPKKAQSSAALPLHYEFIAGDLKRIGILTGIIVILLIVAYYIFS